MGYLNLVGSFVYKEPLFRAKLAALANNDAQLKTDGWAQNTKCLFFQATVPSGWTQDVSQNDKALRVVGSTGGGVSGGVTALSSTIVLAHTHSAFSSDGNHGHSYVHHTHSVGGDDAALSSTNFGNFLYDSGDGALTPSKESGFHQVPITQLYGLYGEQSGTTVITAGAHTHGATTSSLTDMVFAYCDVIVGTKNAPGGTYTDLTAYFHTGDKADFDPFSQFAASDAYNFGNLMPAATVMILGQATAPIGWTLVISVNDRMLRVVSGVGGGSGGSQPLSAGVGLTHSHTVPVSSSHVHNILDHAHDLLRGSSVYTVNGGASLRLSEAVTGTRLATTQIGGGPVTIYKTITTVSGGGNCDAGGIHTHTLPSALTDVILAYVDVIQCSKNSAGAPYAYTDYTAEFAWKKLISKQRLNTLAQNDAYIQYHTTPFGTQAFFYMASPPSGWVKLTSQHDKSLRIVSGGTGGLPGGGSQLLSAPIALAHTHAIVTASHTHTSPHIHPVATASISGSSPTASPQYWSAGVTFPFLGPGGGNPQFVEYYGDGGAAFAFSKFLTKVTGPPYTNPDLESGGGHVHGGATNSQLTDVQLAYADVIWCVKS